MIKNMLRFTRDSTNLYNFGLMKPFFRRTCYENNILFKGVSDGIIYENFPLAETVVFNKCGGKFVFDNLKPENFPSVKTVITDSHPHDPEVLHRMGNINGGKVFLIDYYYYSYLSWFENYPYIEGISKEDMDLLMNEYKIRDNRPYDFEPIMI